MPKVHVEASTEARIILAGLLLKLGGFGLLIVIKILKNLIFIIVLLLSFLGFTLTNLLVIFQSDIKSFLAFSSVVHINFVIISFIIINKINKFSSFFIIIRHGFVSVLLFYFIGEIYKINIRRKFYFIKNLFFNNYKFLVLILFCYFFNIGLPLNLSFFSEVFGFLGLINIKFLLIFFSGFYFFYSFIFTIIIFINHYLGKQKIKISEKKNNGFFGFLILVLAF